MHLFAAIGSVLLFISSLSLTFSDAAWAARGDTATQIKTSPMQSLSYRSGDTLHTLDYWPGRGQNALLVVFVHGDKPAMTGSPKLEDCRARGHAVAALRCPPMARATAADEAAETARAVAYLKHHASTLGFDPHRIVVIGNGVVPRPTA